MDARRETSRLKSYPSDLTDEQWELLAPLLPAAPGGGRPPNANLREIVNAVRYLNRTGCGWRHLPHDLPPEGTVRDYFHRWRRAGVWQHIHDTLRRAVREDHGRQSEPTAAIIDSQSIKATRTTGTRGYDAGKKINGRKRHLMVDTLGLLLCVVVHVASIQDRDGAKRVFDKCRRQCPTVRLVWADGGYAGKLVSWTHEHCPWKLEIVKRSDTAAGFQLLPRRWVVERTIAWINNYRRLAKDYEYWEETSTAMIHVAMIDVMLRRLTAQPAAQTIQPLETA
jgi:putative transposase